MTSLEQHTGRPAIEPWLRGWVDDDAPQTTVVWRTHLPIREDITERRDTLTGGKAATDFFAAAPIRESEKLETDTYRVTDWLQKRANVLLNSKQEMESGAGAKAHATGDGTADTAEMEQTSSPTRRLRCEDTVVLVLSASGECEAQHALGDLARPRDSKVKSTFESGLSGKILIVDVRFGGLKAGLLNPHSDGQFDTADETVEWSKKAGFRVRRVLSGSEEEPRRKIRDDGWRPEAAFDLRYDAEGVRTEYLVVEHFRDVAGSEEGRSVSNPQELGDHQRQAEHKARSIAVALGLVGPSLDVLAVSAFLHDEGKKAPRWQRAFNAPEERRDDGSLRIYAKTKGPIDHKVLDGYRHEFGSLPYAKEDSGIKRLPEDWDDLALHLIASHHGQARPVIETRGCEDAPPTALEERACEVALRFARLQRRWGPWGLAWWEALLRAADQQASRDNDQFKTSDASEAGES
jgi:CRISPR-associated endonuclease/helicase Cas3